MVTSKYPSDLLFSEEFVESAGAIIFNIAESEICLVRHREHHEWLLPKGRRNCGESRHDAALREVREETGYHCRLLPVTMKTRAPPSIEVTESPDEVREFDDLVEPFSLTIRRLGEHNLKLIWWYIAVVNDSFYGVHGIRSEEEKFQVQFFSYDEAVEVLTYDLDKSIVRKAVNLVKSSYA